MLLHKIFGSKITQIGAACLATVLLASFAYYYTQQPATHTPMPTPTNPDGQNPAEQIAAAKKLTAQGKHLEAIKVMQDTAKKNPKNAEVIFNFGLALAEGKLYPQAEQAYQLALKLTPNHPVILTCLGFAFYNDKKYEQALETYQKVLTVNPGYFDATLQMSRTYYEIDQFEKAEQWVKKALAIKPDHVQATIHLGHVHNKLGNLDAAIAQYGKAIKLEPNSANAHYNLGYTLRVKGDLQAALPELNKAIELNPDYLDAHIALAQTYWGLEDFENGFKEYEWRWKLHGMDPQSIKSTMWDGSPLGTKSILVFCEQGLGDSIQFIRYAQIIKEQNPAAKIIAKVQGPLVPILSRCKYIDAVVTAKTENPPKYDTQAPLMSLPMILKTKPNKIPAPRSYLEADPKLVQYWKDKLSPDKNFKIGICWHVDPSHELDKSPISKRSLALSLFEPLSQLKGVSFYSLQKINGTDQLKDKPKGLKLTTFGADFDEAHGRFMDTAALMVNLDLIVSSDTSIVHLAGALGKPVWMLLPYSPDCRWYLGRSDSPWYPTMRIFRQPKPYDWKSAMNEVKTALKRTTEKKVIT